MLNKIYLIKNPTIWMMDELIAFSYETKFSIIFLRKPLPSFNSEIEQLSKNGTIILLRPFKYNQLIKKLIFVVIFCLKNIEKFFGGYNTAISTKSIYWFIRLDSTIFKQPISLHAQYATQAALISFMLNQYIKKDVDYYFTFHAHDIYFRNKWFTQLVNGSSRTFSISNYNIRYVKEKYKKLNVDKIVVSRLGVFQNNINIVKQNHRKVKIIGFLSWFHEKKGIFYLLDAVKKLSKDYPGEFKLKLAGEGQLKEKILEYIDKNNLGSIIEYSGIVNGGSKQDYYGSIDVFVLPSITLKNDKDGLPVVLMDAVSYGIPIITTNISGLPEICINNYNGILVNERKSGEIYNAVLELFQNDSKYNKYTSNALKVAAQYNIIRNSHYKLKCMNWIEG